MVKKRGLGKSLNALLAYTSTETSHFVDIEDKSQEKLTQMNVDDIQRGKYQPRREIDLDSLQELSESIRAQGILQPLIVRPIGDKHEIIAGERRFRAAKLAGLTRVPVIIRDIPDEAAIAIALIENIQRENLNPVEEAVALQRLISEFGMTHQQVAEAVGKSRVSVTNLLRLLALPSDIKSLLEQGQLEMGHARALLTLPENIQLEVSELIVSKSLSVRETENLVRQIQTPMVKRVKNPVSPDIVHLQEDLTQRLKMRVAIQCNAKGKGKLIIHYRNLKELDGILAQFSEQ